MGYIEVARVAVGKVGNAHVPTVARSPSEARVVKKERGLSSETRK